MNWWKTSFLVATTLALLGIDTLVGVSGTLYMGPIAGLSLVGFIVAVPVIIAVRRAPVLFLLHDAALGYFLVRSIRAGFLDHLAEFTGIAVLINLLLAVIVWLRGLPSAVPSSGGRGGATMVAIVAAITLWAGPSIARDGVERRPDCLIRLPHQSSLARFNDWPAPRNRPHAPAPPVLSSPEARRFRSVLRGGAAAGPNFAGHFTIVVWGCGASCTSAVIVDARTGRVIVPPLLQAISAVHVADVAGPDGFNSLRFRLDSRLLVVLGAPGEDEERDGATMLEWNGTALRMLRFVPRTELCPG
jgi:hypothetical protein